MKYECKLCENAFDEGDIEKDEEGIDCCPHCGDREIEELEDSEYGN